MKRNFIAAALCALSLCAQASAAPAPAAAPQDKPKEQAAPQAPEAEIKAARAVEAAADAAAAVTAADDFVKKYPKSVLRPQVLRIAAGKVSGTQDAAQRVAHTESLLKIFAAPEEANLINPHLVHAYVAASRLDDAYRVGSLAAVEKFEDPVGIMLHLALIGENEARKQNLKFSQQSQQLGLRAAELIEGDKRPAALDAAVWTDYRTNQLPKLYNALAVLSFVGKDMAGAKGHLAKAVAAKSAEPATFILLGSIADAEYQQTATEHRSASGAARDELMKKAQGQSDEAIEAFAHAVALTEGNAAYDQIRPQLMQALEWHYKFRHDGSAEGMQKVIDKYKKPAGPK